MLNSKELTTLLYCSSLFPTEQMDENADTGYFDDRADKQVTADNGEGEISDLHQKSVLDSTISERKAAGQYSRQRLKKLVVLLNKLCCESDPQFVKVGRDLTIVSQEVKKLIDSTRHAASHIKDNQQDNNSLRKIEQLVKGIFSTLSNEQKIIDKDAVQVRNLVSEIFKCDSIREKINRINTLFRIVRINIRIQCSARGLSEDLFEGVSEDLEHLSKNLHNVTKQILRDIKQGAKSLESLQKSITEHLVQMDAVFQQTQMVASKAFQDIKQLMQGTETMIIEADARSKKVSDKVGEVIVGIQFHDSLNQRIDHVVRAFEDIMNLCDEDKLETSEESLGTSFIILDLQLRQLLQISKEIKLVRERINADFLAIETEIAGLSTIFHDPQFREIGPQKFLSSLFSSLENTLTKLNSLLDEGDGMLGQIEKTSYETKSIANDLMQLKENVSEIREETRVQAVNTVIMASALGNKGKTIEVLAKEIQTLSEQSSVLADDIEAMHLAVNQTIEELISSTAQKDGDIDRTDLVREISIIKGTFSEVMHIVEDLSQQIEISKNNIRTTRSALLFIDSMEANIHSAINELGAIRDKLLPWQDMGTHDNEDVAKLIERYSMEQERMIHMFGQTEEKEDTVEDDILF